MANSPSSKVSFLELKSQQKALGRQKLVEWRVRGREAARDQPAIECLIVRGREKDP